MICRLSCLYFIHLKYILKIVYVPMCPILMICIILLFWLTFTNLDRLQHISFVIISMRFNLVIMVIVLLLYITIFDDWSTERFINVFFGGLYAVLKRKFSVKDLTHLFAEL